MRNPDSSKSRSIRSARRAAVTTLDYAAAMRRDKVTGVDDARALVAQARIDRKCAERRGFRLPK